MARLFRTGADVMAKTVKGAMRFGDNLLDVLRGFIRMFEKGVDEVVAFFKKIIDDFFDWLEDMFKKGKVDEVLENPSLSKYGKIYRVQGGNEAPNISKFRLFLKNNKVLIEGDDMIHVTFDDEFRVAQFWTKRGNKAEVFTAEINSKFIEKIKQDAVSQKRAKEFPNRPQIDDPKKTKKSYGIPKNYFDELLESMENPNIIKYE